LVNEPAGRLHLKVGSTEDRLSELDAPSVLAIVAILIILLGADHCRGPSRWRAVRRVVNSELAAARATSKVMAALPPCGIAIGYLLGGDPARWLLARPAGWTCLLTGIFLACAGVLWIEVLAQRAAPY
jgi:hypothetical protein